MIGSGSLAMFLPESCCKITSLIQQSPLSSAVSTPWCDPHSARPPSTVSGLAGCSGRAGSGHSVRHGSLDRCRWRGGPAGPDHHPIRRYVVSDSGHSRRLHDLERMDELVLRSNGERWLRAGCPRAAPCVRVLLYPQPDSYSTNSRRRKRRADQFASIDTCCTISKPARRITSQSLSRLRSTVELLVEPLG